MKKLLISALAFGVLFVFTGESLKVNASDEYSIDIKEENNLANWKYDWDVVGIGAGKTTFDSGHLRMENINMASSNYALYKTNKFNEFRLDMYANLNLPGPSDTGFEGQFDYANLYLTAFIDYDDATQVENVAMSACPWYNNKGWISICFERIQGVSHIQMLVNESFDGNGANRYFLQSDNPQEGSVISNIDWCNNNYHYFTIEATSTHAKDPSRPRPKEIGTTFKVYIDGVLQTSYFQSNAYYSNTHKQDEVIPFDTQKGYIGFWASSGYSASATTENTGVAVDITKLQITSYDNTTKEEATPYTRCVKPQFNLKSIDNFAPAASYDANEEMEIKLSELFEYDGDKKLTYEATYNGEKIGSIRNGYFVWEPTKGGVYNIIFKASDGELEATNEVRFRVNEQAIDKPSENPSEEPSITPSETKPDDEKPSSGCKGSVSSLTYLSFAFLSLVLLLKKNK